MGATEASLHRWHPRAILVGMIRIAHISDLHFSKFSLSPAQFFSKQWLGNMNLLFNRSNQYLNERPFSLIPEFKDKGITHVIISGDLTTTSTPQEYKIAKGGIAHYLYS